MIELRPAAPMQPVEVEPSELGGTIASLDRAARAAGFETWCHVGFGVRLPRQPQQQYAWQAWQRLVGTDGAVAFHAMHTEADGWECSVARPGWPVDPSATTTTLRQLFAARTPTVLR